MNRLNFYDNRSLVLRNCLILKKEFNSNTVDFQIDIEQMKSYIKVRAAKQVGPLIQYIHREHNKNTVNLSLILQCDRFIHKVDNPYAFSSCMQVKKCLYCRYEGPEEQINIGIDKIKVEAFERNILLKGDCYIVYLQNNKDNILIADVFMECKG